MVGVLTQGMDEPTVREWRVPALSSASAIGEKVLAILMANPKQVLRCCRIEDEILLVAVEGERWERTE